MKKNEKILIISSGILPVPATKGGAVENLIEHIINGNEKYNNLNLEVVSIYDKDSAKKSEIFKNTNFKFVKSNVFIDFLDNILFFIMKNIFHKEKMMSFRHAFRRLFFIKKVSDLLAKGNYDKILVENSSSLFLALKWKKNYKKYKDKYYYHVHNEVNSLYGCDDIMRSCKGILCISEFIKTSISKTLNLDVNSKNLFIVKNCINVDKFDGNLSKGEKNELIKKYNIASDSKIIIFTGRLTKEKGIEELLKALVNVNYGNYQLLIVGSYFFDSNIKNDFISSLNNLTQILGEKVKFTGFVDYDKLPKVYALADFAVLPSIWEEPAGLTIIEALSSGLPLITTNSGGIPEYISKDATILIERDKNLILNLTKSIEKLLINDNDLVSNMKKNARKDVLKFSPDNYYNDIVSVLMGDEINE